MRKPFSIFVVGAAVAVALLVPVAGYAGQASGPTWTVKPGGSAIAKSGKTTLTDAGVKLSCMASSEKLVFKHGRGLSGTNIGAVNSLSFSGCAGPDVALTVTTSHFPWHINAVSYTSASGVTNGTVTGIHAQLSGGSCNAVVDGTGASANNGKVSFAYTNSTGMKKVTPTGGNLRVYDSTCPTLIRNGKASFSGTWTISPKQTITSP